MAEGVQIPQGYIDRVCKYGKPGCCVYAQSDYSSVNDEVRCMKGDADTERVVAGIAKYHSDKGAPLVNCSGTPKFIPS